MKNITYKVLKINVLGMDYRYLFPTAWLMIKDLNQIFVDFVFLRVINFLLMILKRSKRKLVDKKT